MFHSECYYSFIFIFHFTVFCSEEANLHVFEGWIIFPVIATCCNLYVENQVLSTRPSPFPYFLAHFLEEFYLLSSLDEDCFPEGGDFYQIPARGLGNKENWNGSTEKAEERTGVCGRATGDMIVTEGSELGFMECCCAIARKHKGCSRYSHRNKL